MSAEAAVELIDGGLADTFQPAAACDHHSQPGAAPLRAGIGIIAPADFAIDRELWRWAPEAATLHVTRLGVPIYAMTADCVGKLTDATALAAATSSLLMPSPSIVAYACSSASFAHGAAGERRLVDAMLGAGAPAALTTSGAMINALQQLDARRIAVVTPYLGGISSLLCDFLAEHGITVVSEHSLGLDRRIWDLSSMDVSVAVQAADHPDADAVFVSCTNLRTYDLIAPLQHLLGKPVLTANQVTMWAALKAAGYCTADPDHILHGSAADLPSAA